tara:strand:- start:198 stop:647 length:450 start_codon:yes stop_codon:yes gene_type:complete
MSKQFESAYDEIIETIDYKEAKEIVDHGCQSGVCSQYIYYADTIKFFDNYEEEITDYIITCCGSEILANIFLDNNCSIDMYKNEATWCYVELICSQIVDKYEYESTTCEELSDLDDDESIKLYADYSKEEKQAIIDSDWGKKHLVFVNA